MFLQTNGSTSQHWCHIRDHRQRLRGRRPGDPALPAEALDTDVEHETDDDFDTDDILAVEPDDVEGFDEFEPDADDVPEETEPMPSF